MARGEGVVSEALPGDNLDCLKEPGAIRAAPVVEPVGEFVGVAEEMLGQRVSIRTVHHAVEQSPVVLHSVRVYPSFDVSNGMVYERTLEALQSQMPVGVRRVGEDLGGLLYVGFDNRGYRGIFRIRDNGGAYLAVDALDTPHLIFSLPPLQQSENDGLASGAGTLYLHFLLREVHVLRLAADERFVHFDGTRQHVKRAGLQDVANPVEKKPCSPLRDAEGRPISWLLTPFFASVMIHIATSHLSRPSGLSSKIVPTLTENCLRQPLQFHR
jgi:hypothetical protein